MESIETGTGRAVARKQTHRHDFGGGLARQRARRPLPPAVPGQAPPQHIHLILPAHASDHLRPTGPKNAARKSRFQLGGEVHEHVVNHVRRSVGIGELAAIFWSMRAAGTDGWGDGRARLDLHTPLGIEHWSRFPEPKPWRAAMVV
jgi:hypothetical protein